MRKSRTSLEPSVTVDGNRTVVSLGTYEVKIYPLTEKGRNPRYRVTWWREGSRNTVTTEDYAAAVTRAKEIIQLRVSGRDEVAQISTEKLAYYQDCERALGVPLDVAVRFYVANNPNAFTPLHVEDLVEDYVSELELREGKRGASEEWVRTVRRRTRAFSDAFPMPIHEVTSNEIKRFIYNPAWGERTQFNYQQVVSMLYTRAREKKALPGGPTAYDEFKPKIEKPVETEKEVLPPAHLRAMFKAAIDSGREKFLPYLAIGAFGGVRSQEICRLRWGTHIDLEERVIRCTRDITKTGRRRLVDMNDALFEWLSEHPGKDGELVQPYDDHHRILTILWRDEAKLPRWPHNALRVSFISYSMVHTGNAATTANTAGHSETMLQTVYKQIHGVSKKFAKEWFDLTPSRVKDNTPAAHHTQPDGGYGRQENKEIAPQEETQTYAEPNVGRRPENQLHLGQGSIRRA